MAYVIAEPCIDVKDRSCVAVCPKDCIEEGTVEVNGVTYDQLFIDPVQCIDCGLCETECPVDAIYTVDELPDKWKAYIDVNKQFYKTGKRRGSQPF